MKNMKMAIWDISLTLCGLQKKNDRSKECPIRILRVRSCQLAKISVENFLQNFGIQALSHGLAKCQFSYPKLS